MKMRFLLSVLVVLLITLAGCQSSSQERLEGLNQFLGIAQEQSQSIDADIADLEVIIGQLKTQLADPCTSQGDLVKLVEVFKQAQDVLEMAVTKKAEIDTAITQANAAIAQITAQGDANYGDEISAAGEVLNAASRAIPPPYGVFVGLAGTVLAMIGGVISRRYKAALTNVVYSVDKAKDKQPPIVVDEINKVLEIKQTDATKALVKEIRAKV